MAEGTGTSNPWRLSWGWVELCRALHPCQGPILLCPLDPRASLQLEPTQCHQDVGCGAGNSYWYFFQAVTPSLDPWLSSPRALPCSPGCGGTVSAREPPPSQLGPSSQGPGSGIWDGVGTGALPQGLLRGEGSTEAETHDTDPRNGWWLFFSRLLSLTRSSSGGRGELSSTTPHSGKRYEKYKNKEAYI